MARRMNPWVGWGLALLVAGGFSALGFWQLGRAEQKAAMLEGVRHVLDDRDPKPLSVAADAARARSYDWAVGRGEFAQAPLVLLDNQQRNGTAGVRAYRLFEPVDAPPLLIELGWLPLPPDRKMPTISRPHDMLAPRGLLAPPPSRGIVSPEAAMVPDAFLPTVLTIGLDAPNLPRLLGVDSLPPRVLRLDPESELCHVCDLDILPNTMPPERHIAYAVQWFGLALAVLATAALLTFRRRRSGRAKMTA